MRKSAAFFAGIIVVLLAGFFAVSSPVLAVCPPDSYGLCNTANNAGLDKQTSVSQVTGNVIGTALSMVAVLFFGLMIYGGINWMLDRGNEDRAKKALDTIIAAVIGIIIVLGSYAITRFVFGSVAGAGTPGPSTSGTTSLVERHNV